MHVAAVCELSDIWWNKHTICSKHLRSIFSASLILSFCFDHETYIRAQSMSSVNSSLNQEIIFFLKMGNHGNGTRRVIFTHTHTHTHVWLHVRCMTARVLVCVCASAAAYAFTRLTSIKYYNAQGINLIKSDYTSADWQLSCLQTGFLSSAETQWSLSSMSLSIKEQKKPSWKKKVSLIITHYLFN